jgi:hypothetical protein
MAIDHPLAGKLENRRRPESDEVVEKLKARRCDLLERRGIGALTVRLFSHSRTCPGPVSLDRLAGRRGGRSSYVRQVLQNGEAIAAGIFLCSAERHSPSRPDLLNAPRTAAVNAGRRPPRSAARSGVEGREHGAIVRQAGTLMPPASASAFYARANDSMLR